MLKETEKKQDFFITFLSLAAIRLGEGRPGPPLSGYACDCNFNAICDIKILCALLLVFACVHVKLTLMVLFCVIILNMLNYW